MYLKCFELHKIDHQSAKWTTLVHGPRLSRNPTGARRKLPTWSLFGAVCGIACDERGRDRKIGVRLRTPKAVWEWEACAEQSRCQMSSGSMRMSEFSRFRISSTMRCRLAGPVWSDSVSSANGLLLLIVHSYSDVSPFPKKENGCGFRFRLPVGLCSRSQRSKSARRQRRIRPVPALI